MKKVKHHTGKLLVESLTTDQIAALLDVVFSTGDLNRYAERLKKADPDMAETVDKILRTDNHKTGKSQVVRLASDQRTIEHWNSLWSHWDTLVLDVGDEEGKYAVREAHWEPPYFDGSALADDLDRIASDMLRLINDVYDLVEDPDLFSEALDEIDSNISSYPEWMGVEHSEGCTLERNATRCVLKWLWLSSQQDAHPGKAFLDKVYDIEDHCDMVDMDKNECVDFFAKLPGEVCREIYECFKDDGDRYNLDNVYSSWHRINLFYEERFDSAGHLETCRKHLGRNWRYGRPLIDDAVNQGDYQKAESLLVETFSSYLGRADNAAWYPEKSLLLDERRYYHEGNREDVSGLLESWAKVSKKLGDTKRKAASEIQSVIFRAPEDWDAVIGEYKKQRKPQVKKVIDPLFAHWQTEMARRSICYDMDARVSSDTWIHWLIEAELSATGKKKWFMEKLNTWLASLKKNSNAFGKQWHLLARLTKDLPESSKLKKQYPTFYKIVLPEDHETSLLGKARCSGLKKMNAGTCLSTAMDVWKNRLRHIVPDPAHSHKSDYTHHAQWMKALHELSHEAYDGVLAKWHKKHKRRRNLWRDMQSHSLPV
ncbi:MAG: hypothetical protein KAU38_15855 [Desulfobacterales bacterium]|nr:hypothetical protein [Desulfobacterales bacterium]